MQAVNPQRLIYSTKHRKENQSQSIETSLQNDIWEFKPERQQDSKQQDSIKTNPSHDEMGKGS